MGICLLQGILIGLLFGMPVGAVGTMTVQRTLDYDIKAGLLTGLGSSAADCLYACIGVCGLTLVSEFLLRYQTVINILGGSFILLLGFCILVKKPNADGVKQAAADRTKMFVSSFIVGIANPAAILTFLFAFSYFGIGKNMSVLQGIGLVAGVFAGTYTWWSVLSGLTAFLKKKLRSDRLQSMNKVFGTILVILGSTVCIRTLM